GCLLDVGIDIGGADREEALAAAALQRRDDGVHLGIDHRLQPALAALRRVVEDERSAARELDVALLERREAVAAMLVRVLLAADAKEPAVEQPHGAGELPPPAASGEIGAGGRPPPAHRPRAPDRPDPALPASR